MVKDIDRAPEPGPSTASTSRIAGPSTAPPVDASENDEEDEDDEDDDDADEDDLQAETEQFPISHEVTLQDHTKLVSALTLDGSGARILSGSHDYDCKMWDFGGMGGNHKPFRSWEPAGSYYVGLFLNATSYPLRSPCVQLTDLLFARLVIVHRFTT